MQYHLGNGSNGNEIVFLHRPHVLDVESNKGLSFAGCGYELDLQSCGLVHLYNSSQISGAKAMLWQVSVKDYCVEKLVFHSVSPGKAVTNSGTSLSNRTIQTVNTLAIFQMEHSNYHEFRTFGHTDFLFQAERRQSPLAQTNLVRDASSRQPYSQAW